MCNFEIKLILFGKLYYYLDSAIKYFIEWVIKDKQVNFVYIAPHSVSC